MTHSRDDWDLAVVFTGAAGRFQVLLVSPEKLVLFCSLSYGVNFPAFAYLVTAPTSVWSRSIVRCNLLHFQDWCFPKIGYENMNKHIKCCPCRHKIEWPLVSDSTSFADDSYNAYRTNMTSFYHFHSTTNLTYIIRCILAGSIFFTLLYTVRVGAVNYAELLETSADLKTWKKNKAEFILKGLFCEKSFYL